MKSSTKPILFLLLLLAIVALVLPRFSKRWNMPAHPPQPDIPMPITFDGNSDTLKATEIIPTLNTTIAKGKNIIWCASFLSAWKALQQDLAKEPVVLEGNPEAANLLNSAEDPRPLLPATTFYVATGWNWDGITNQIQNDLCKKFPNKTLPTFQGITSNSFLAYSYLEADVKFTLPYNQNEKPLVFCDEGGNKAEINSFGILPEDHDDFYELRKQSRVLFRTGDTQDELEFAIDLCSGSSPNEIIVARIPQEPTLALMLARVDKKISEMGARLNQEAPGIANHLQSIGATDSLLIPNFHWFISHRFPEIEGLAFTNSKLKGQHLAVAQQDILFRLDKSGVALRSESKQYNTAIANDYLLNRPFLVIMKKRDAPKPYFVMWVDNAELLTPWHTTGK